MDRSDPSPPLCVCHVRSDLSQQSQSSCVVRLYATIRDTVSNFCMEHLHTGRYEPTITRRVATRFGRVRCLSEPLRLGALLRTGLPLLLAN